MELATLAILYLFRRDLKKWIIEIIKESRKP